MTLPGAGELAGVARGALIRSGVDEDALGGPVAVISPVNGARIASMGWADPARVDAAVTRGQAAFAAWRVVPAPARGAVVKRFGELLTEHAGDLADLVTAESGKITSGARGEVRAMIDVCDFAVGLSRQLYGRTMSSQRPGHRLAETWHPLGVAAVITAFDFPLAAWSANAAVALVCGDPVIWKPSEATPLTSLAANALLTRAITELGAPEYLSQVVLGGAAAGEALAGHPAVALVSATGSTRMGQDVAPRVAARFGRLLLELGGNNAAVVAPSADLALAAGAIVSAAAAGQRCTATRRVIAHHSVVGELTSRLADAYRRLPVGNPYAGGTLVGPLISHQAWTTMREALAEAAAQGGEVTCGGERVLAGEAPGAYYAEPALVRMPGQTPIVREETFAPVLYVMAYSDFDEAIALNNGVAQGLSSSVFTRDQAEAELFASAEGSDCGLVYVNTGTSGAEVGGPVFIGTAGGEKETGGGRESGSDAWKAYMRRATTTVNYSGTLTTGHPAS